jgi:hypothetical protein
MIAQLANAGVAIGRRIERRKSALDRVAAVASTRLTRIGAVVCRFEPVPRRAIAGQVCVRLTRLAADKRGVILSVSDDLAFTLVGFLSSMRVRKRDASRYERCCRSNRRGGQEPSHIHLPLSNGDYPFSWDEKPAHLVRADDVTAFRQPPGPETSVRQRRAVRVAKALSRLSRSSRPTHNLSRGVGPVPMARQLRRAGTHTPSRRRA